MIKVKLELDESYGPHYDESINNEEYISIDYVKKEFQEKCDVDGCDQLLQSNEKGSFEVINDNRKPCIERISDSRENCLPAFPKKEKDIIAYKKYVELPGLKEMENKICRCHMWKYCKRFILRPSGKVKDVQLYGKNSVSHYNTTLQNQLSVHLNSVHLSLENKKCTLCNFRTTHEAYLKRHIKAIHMKVENPAENIRGRLCDYFETHNKLIESNSKLSTNSRERKQICKQCGYSTNRRDLFRTHSKFAHLKIII